MDPTRRVEQFLRLLSEAAAGRDVHHAIPDVLQVLLLVQLHPRFLRSCLCRLAVLSPLLHVLICLTRSSVQLATQAVFGSHTETPVVKKLAYDICKAGYLSDTECELLISGVKVSACAECWPSYACGPITRTAVGSTCTHELVPIITTQHFS